MAADPAKYKEAVSRLRQLSPQGSDFASLLDQGQSATPAEPAARSALQGAQPSRFPESDPTAPASSGTAGLKDLFTQLEAFLMQTFVQSMLPKEAPSVYGKGTAGDVWKSMLAEKIGGEVAKSGQLGIAKRLAATNITTSAIARAAPVGSLLPVSATMPGLVSQRPTAPPPTSLASAVTALQEIPASQGTTKVSSAWITTVHKEQV